MPASSVQGRWHCGYFASARCRIVANSGAPEQLRPSIADDVLVYTTPPLERAVEITVDDPTIIEHLGDAYEKVGKPDRALASYREAVKRSKEADQIKRIREKIQRLEKKI